MLLLDAHEPWRIIRRPAEPFITPREDYERRGFMPDVVFPTGLVQRENGTYYLYYGAADDKICGCEVDVDAVTAEW